MQKIDTITKRVMKKITVDELTICGYMRKFQLSRDDILAQLEFTNLYSEVFKLRLAMLCTIKDFNFYGEKLNG